MKLFYNKAVQLCLLILLSISYSKAQTDTLIAERLNEVVVNAFGSQATQLRTTASVGLLTPKVLARYSPTTWAAAINTIPGVKMEERSPGSYRFSIRGSLIRSPFGVRNVKFYWNDIPFTDASGNTALNAFDYQAIDQMQIIKGPGSSLYGAGTGGVVLLRSNGTSSQNSISQSIGFGKYGFYNQSTHIQLGNTSIQYGHTEQKGYRNHSTMARDAVRFNTQLKAGSNGNLSLLGMYSDLHYQTPGGINLAQYQTDPTLARQATPTLPGSETQKAGIYNKLFMMGLNYNVELTKSWTFNDFANPFITNYEKRDEQGIGGRNVWSNKTTFNKAIIHWTSGFEWQYGKSAQRNFDNNKGVPDKIQTSEDIKSFNLSAFSQLEATLKPDLTVSAGLSYNTLKYNYERFVPLPYSKEKKQFKGIISPRIAVNKVIDRNWSVTAAYSEGFSPPTLQEVRPSAGGFRTGLNAEKGTNTEINLRRIGENLAVEVNLYHFSLRETIVSRTDENGSEYFVNAGKTNQNGLEWNISYILPFKLSNNSTFKVWTNGNSINYRFKDYMRGENNFSGNRLPGIPKFMQATGVDASLPYGFAIYATYQHQDYVFLNDANNVKSTPVNQWTARVSWTKNWTPYLYSEISASAEKVNAGIYSLGYDFNAFGGRYYNSSPKNNLWAGAKLVWHWPSK